MRVAAVDLGTNTTRLVVAGLVVLREVLVAYRLGAIEVSVRDLLDGVALEAAELPERVEGAVPPTAFTCC